MNCSLYLINASENNINWFERRLGSFYYENTGVNKLSENDLVYFVFESKVTLAVKSSSHKPFREIKTFDLSKKISEFIINLDSNRRIKPHVINNIRLKEISIDRPLKIDELLPLLYTELLRIYSKSSSNLLYEEQMNYKSELIDFFENEIKILYQTLKKFEKYDNEKILNAIKLLEPEDYEVAEFKLKEQDDKYNELNILNAKYKDEFNKSSGNMHVLDFIPNNVAVQNTLDALLLANCFTKDRIVELLRENYSNEVDIAIEEYIKKGNILQANLVELQGKINSLKKKLNLDYVDNTEHFPDKIVEDVAVNSKTVGSNYNLNELYDIAPIINKASLNLIDNSYFYKSPVVIIFMTDSGIEQKSEDGNEWVLFGEGNANNGSQTFGQNCNTRVKMGVDILLFKMVNNRTCKFKGVANYVSYRERIDKISNKSRTIINFTLRLV